MIAVLCNFSSEQYAGNSVDHLVVVQGAEDLLGVFGGLCAHRPVTEVLPELVEGDQPARTFLYELPGTQIAYEQMVPHKQENNSELMHFKINVPIQDT